jgi:hypothetical protein
VIHYDPNPASGRSGGLSQRYISPHGIPSDVVYGSRNALSSSSSSYSSSSSSSSTSSSQSPAQRMITLNKNKFALKWQVQLKCTHYSASDIEGIFNDELKLQGGAGGTGGSSGGAKLDSLFGSVDTTSASLSSSTMKSNMLRGRFSQAGNLVKALDDYSSQQSNSGQRIGQGSSSSSGGGSGGSGAKKDEFSDEINGIVSKINDINRLKLFRVLFVDWIAPETDRDSGSIRARYMIQVTIPPPPLSFIQKPYTTPNKRTDFVLRSCSLY